MSVLLVWVIFFYYKHKPLNFNFRYIKIERHTWSNLSSLDGFKVRADNKLIFFRWIECPDTLTGGKNLHIFVKGGSHPWDARFQVQN